jgi:hypothetical protein
MFIDDLGGPRQDLPRARLQFSQAFAHSSYLLEQEDDYCAEPLRQIPCSLESHAACTLIYLQKIKISVNVRCITIKLPNIVSTYIGAISISRKEEQLLATTYSALLVDYA